MQYVRHRQILTVRLRMLEDQQRHIRPPSFSRTIVSAESKHPFPVSDDETDDTDSYPNGHADEFDRAFSLDVNVASDSDSSESDDDGGLYRRAADTGLAHIRNG